MIEKYREKLFSFSLTEKAVSPVDVLEIQSQGLQVPYITMVDR